MNNFKLYFYKPTVMKSVIFLVLVAILLSCTTNKTTIEAERHAPTKVEKLFPRNWYGKWKGTLVIYNNKGKAQEIPMELHCGPTDSTHRHQMALVYGEGEKQDFRDYELVVVNAENGHYKTDEKNTIYLDDYYFDNILYSRFEVMGNLLLIRIEKRNEKLYFEVVMGKGEPISTTGNDNENDVPPVNSYNITISQRAELTKYE